MKSLDNPKTYNQLRKKQLQTKPLSPAISAKIQTCLRFPSFPRVTLQKKETHAQIQGSNKSK